MYVRSIVKDGLQTSSLAILGAIYYGFAGLVGSFLGGQIFYRYGSNQMFTTGLISACVGLITLTYTIKNSKLPNINA
jgi:predicted MFS family arabinose efflux permease